MADNHVTPLQYYIGQALQGLITRHGASIDQDAVSNFAGLAVELAVATQAAEAEYHRKKTAESTDNFLS